MALAIEGGISNAIFGVLGRPEFIGLGLMAFFTLLVTLYPTHPGLKILVLLVACVLAFPFLPFLAIVGGLGSGGILWIAGTRLWQR